MSSNFLNANEFRLKLHRLPNVSFYCQRAMVPGLSVAKVDQPNPFNMIPLHGDKPEFEPLNVTFRVDEDMTNHQEIMRWMIGLSFPDTFNQHTNLLEGDGLYSDGSLLIMNSTSNPNVEIRFKNMWPSNLSQIDMDITNSEVEYAECSVTFEYETFTYELV